MMVMIIQHVYNLKTLLHQEQTEFFYSHNLEPIILEFAQKLTHTNKMNEILSGMKEKSRNKKMCA